MAKQCFIPRRFSDKRIGVISQANEILEEYRKEGFVPTLRQVYYQFVARGYIPNNMKEYKKLGDAIASARLAGFIDWSLVQDLTRNLMSLKTYHSPQHALTELMNQYHIDMWEDQDYRPEVWIEKDALLGVIAKVCEENDVPYFSCRGYTSLSEVYEAAVRFQHYKAAGQTPYILHFGDHDPSGMDMSRDIHARLQDTFFASHEFCRVALTMDQIEEYNPPANPAKVKDSRFAEYEKEFGDESWELDALKPTVFRELITDRVSSLRNQKRWSAMQKIKDEAKKQLSELIKDWPEIPEMKRNHKLVPELQAEITKLKKRRKKK